MTTASELARDICSNLETEGARVEELFDLIGEMEDRIEDLECENEELADEIDANEKYITELESRNGEEEE